MELQKQVSSLELAKKLKELGVKQTGVFWWSYYPHVDHYEVEYQPGGMSPLNVSAFTVAELGEMLKRADYSLPMWVEDCWHTDYWTNDQDTYETSATEADARAKMLIYLIENKLITL